MTNYTKGRARENYVVQVLRKKGAVYAKRMAASKSLIDVVAVFPREVRLIQVKRKRVDKKEIEELKSLAYNGTQAVLEKQEAKLSRLQYLIVENMCYEGSMFATYDSLILHLRKAKEAEQK